MTMLRPMNHKWLRGILVSAALLVPLGYIGLRNGFAEAQMGTPITPGNSVDATIAPSTPMTTDLSVGSASSIDPSASPASGLSTTSFVDPQATSTDDAVDTNVALDVSEDDTDLVEMAATVDEDAEATIAEDEVEDEGITVSQDHTDSGDYQVAHNAEPSSDEDE